MSECAFVSVVIPCYCCSNTIDRALASIVAQTILPYEVLLVEDSSPDSGRTVDAINLIMAKYSNSFKITIIRMVENSGAASARNAGWMAASQPYIAFLDADDSWHPDKLLIQYEYMLRNPDVILCGHQCLLLQDSTILSKNLPSLSVTEISAVSLLFKNAFSTPTVMVKRNIPFCFLEGKRYAEDLLLWQKIAFSGLQVVRIESPLAFVHKPLYGAGGLSAQLWSMEQAELNNLVILLNARSINFMLFLAAAFISIIKFLKRLVLTSLSRLAKLLSKAVVA